MRNLKLGVEFEKFYYGVYPKTRMNLTNNKIFLNGTHAKAFSAEMNFHSIIREVLTTTCCAEAALQRGIKCIGIQPKFFQLTGKDV